MNYAAHVKFVSKWLEKLDAEAKQAAAPPPQEPGLITEPGLATGPDPDTEPPVAATAPALNVPGESQPESPAIPVGDAEHAELAKAAQAVQG